MTRFLLILPLLLFSVPAMAQEDGTPVDASAALKEAPAKPAVLTADEKERLELAGKMHEIWPIRTRVETALEAVSKNFPEERHDEVKAALRKAIKYDELEEESIKAMAQTFTAPELKAMIAFYGSDEGKSISAKTADYELALRPVMTKMMDAAMLQLRTGSVQ